MTQSEEIGECVSLLSKGCGERDKEMIKRVRLVSEALKVSCEDIAVIVSLSAT